MISVSPVLGFHLRQNHRDAVMLRHSVGNIAIFILLFIESKPFASQPASQLSMHAAACMPDALLMHDPKPLRTPLTGPLLNIAELFSQCSAASQHSPNFMHDLNRNQSKDQRHKRRGRGVTGLDVTLSETDSQRLSRSTKVDVD